MSTRTGAERGPGAGASYRILALGGVAALTASYVAVLHDLATVVGDSSLLFPVVAGAALLGVAVAGVVGERTAGVLALGIAAAGYAYYLLVTPGGLEVVVNGTGKILSDAVALLTGYSVLRLAMADVWSIGFAPAPVFLSVYLAVRRRYVLSVAAGGVALLVLVLTSDAGITVTLFGVLGAVAAVGFGELDRRGGGVEQADLLVVLVVVMAVASLWVPAVGGDGSKPLFLVPGGSAGGTAPGGLAEATDRMAIQGETELSPKVRFTVESERSEYWRVATYDRFTGTGWIRSGRSTQYDDQLLDPVGPSETVEQRVTIESPMRAMPAAARPVSVRGGAADLTTVTDHGGIAPESTLRPGDTYTVESEVLRSTAGELRRAGTRYPEYIQSRDYTQLPDDMPDRVGERTAEVVEDANSPYDKAVAIEEYLEANKEYSLEVDRPDGNIADAFLFEMDAGYCTYYATTMVSMLRTQDIPARMVTGYTPGQELGNDTYVVRGVDAHAWVEVYFPDNGWVRFDPTPASDRVEAETETIREAREDGGTGVDTPESANEPLTETTTSTPEDPGLTNDTQLDNDTVSDGSGNLPAIDNSTDNATTTTLDDSMASATAGRSPADGNGTDDGSGPSLPAPPSPETVAWGLFVGVGLFAGAHRAGLTGRAYRTLRLHRQGETRTPAADAERAGERLETLLAREYRPRRPGETPREYVEALSLAGLDERAERVARLHERARYGDGVSRDEADEAVELVDDLVADRTPLLRRFR